MKNKILISDNMIEIVMSLFLSDQKETTSFHVASLCVYTVYMFLGFPHLLETSIGIHTMSYQLKFIYKYLKIIIVKARL